MQGEPPTKASTPTGAVFLSYASQDAGAAQRICEALRAGGIEVWFDQSELRGGDAWDHKIRDQIHDCRLFIPVISANTERRDEGYFRREWRLAVERVGDMLHKRAFLVPVVIDGTPERGAAVPEKFHELQWTRLPGGDTPPAFVERIRRLLTADPAPATTAAAPATSGAISTPSAHRSSLTKAAIWGAAVTAAVACAYFVAYKFWVPKHLPTARTAAAAPQQTAPSTETAFRPPPHSIAVLPFTNLSGDSKQEYFSDGITEEVINALAHIEGLQVTARTSSFSFRGKDVDIATIARRLNVGAILEGSIRREGNTVRITTQLISAVNGFHIWSEDYDRDLKNLLALQTDIATTVSLQLKARLLGNETAKISAGGTKNPEAYNQYLLGKELYRRGTQESFRGAVAALAKATELDPVFADAYAGLAMAEMDLASDTGDSALIESAGAAADRAIALAPNASRGYRAKAWFRFVTQDFAGGLAANERVVALDPGSSVAWNDYAYALLVFGRFPESITAFRRALQLDPLDAPSLANFAIVLIATGDFEGAHRALSRCLAMNPDNDAPRYSLAVLELLEGSPNEALVEFQKQSTDPLRLMGMAVTEYTLGNRAQAQRAVGQLVARYHSDGAYQIAQVYAWWGQTGKAFYWLGRAHSQREDGLISVAYDPLLRGIRGDSRYTAMLRKLGIAR